MEVSGGHFVTCILNGIIPSLGSTTLLIGLGWAALWRATLDWDSHLRVEKYTSHHGLPEHMNITGLENILWRTEMCAWSNARTLRPETDNFLLLFSMICPCNHVKCAHTDLRRHFEEATTNFCGKWRVDWLLQKRLNAIRLNDKDSFLDL